MTHKEITGIVNLLKPAGMSSHNAVGHVKRLTGTKKAGHSGTLDPMAAGVLPVYLGSATRLIEFSNETTKKYRCEIMLGIVSDTDDIWGTLVSLPLPDVGSRKSVYDISDMIESISGEIEQIPPDYSAISMNGERLYQKARRGEKIKAPARKVKIYDTEIIRTYNNTLIFDVECSRGTYIRALCRDIGESCGLGALMSMLIRTKSGPFMLEDTVTFEELEHSANNNELLTKILPNDTAISHLPKIQLDNKQSNNFLNGIRMKVESSDINVCNRKSMRVYNGNELMGIAELDEDSILKPRKVISKLQ